MVDRISIPSANRPFVDEDGITIKARLEAKLAATMLIINAM